MAKQTAVQFLVMKYNQWQGVLKDRDIEEAKAMEKEQMIHFAETMPKKKGITQEGHPYVQYDAEQYYK